MYHARYRPVEKLLDPLEAEKLMVVLEEYRDRKQLVIGKIQVEQRSFR